MRRPARSISTCPAGLPPDPEDAAYFVAWLDRVIADAGARTDYRTAKERASTLDYLRKARDRYADMAIPGGDEGSRRLTQRWPRSPFVAGVAVEEFARTNAMTSA